MMPKIYILLPVHNRREITRLFIECLKAQTFSDFLLLLIDDGSDDGTAEMVRHEISNTVVLQGNGNWWWAGSLQKGMDWLKAQRLSNDALILIINDDVQFKSNYLENAVRVMSKKSGTLMLSRFRSPDDATTIETGVHANFRNFSFDISTGPDQINCLSTRGLFMHWEDMQRIGGFHTLLLPHYASDWEYTIRAHRKGLNCETCAEIELVPNFDTSGHHVIKEVRFWSYMRTYFSKKTPGNPIYWSLFILLASDKRWIPINLVRVWVRAAKTCYRVLLAPVEIANPK